MLFNVCGQKGNENQLIQYFDCLKSAQIMIQIKKNILLNFNNRLKFIKNYIFFINFVFLLVIFLFILNEN